MSFTEANTEKLKRAAEADERIRRGDHFSDWLALGIGLITLRDTAMHEAQTNTPHGRGYTSVMGRLMKEHPWSVRDKATKSHAMWLADNAGAVIAWRDKLGQNQRERLNHPTTIKRNFERTMLVKEPKPPSTTREKPTPQSRIAELEAELADAQERNTHLEGKVDGSGFHFERDSFEDIKAVIDRLPHKASLKRKVGSIISALQAWHGVSAKR